MSGDETLGLLRRLREAEMLLDRRSDTGARDEVKRVVGGVRSELNASGEFTTQTSLAWLIVERLEMRIGMNNR